jgi:hypothetical protein
MGIKQWFGKSLLSLIQGSNQPAEELRVNRLHDMFSNSIPAMVAFKIDNGYVVRCMNPDAAYTGERTPGFVYCADHQAIADHLVAHAMKDRLGVQQELFGASPRKNVVITKTAGLVGAQQAKSY